MAAVHGAACLALLAIDVVSFPPWAGLYSWWFAGLDLFALLATPMLLFPPFVRAGFLLSTVAGGFQILAVAYLVGHSHLSSILVLMIGLLAIRLFAGWGAARQCPPVEPVRRCAS